MNPVTESTDRPADSALTAPLFATLHTNRGDIRLELFPNHAPKTVRNFVELAEGTREWKDPRTGRTTSAPLYDGVVFHRVIANFMIQGGDPLGTGTGGPGYEFDDEIHPELDFNAPYKLAMANAGKRGGRGTNGSQFFITTAPTTWLQGKHTIFGEVADGAGRQVVDSINTTRTGRGDQPVEPVVIEKVTIERGAR
jgi:peptidyl-prolyl cis-trans isomerase A (cyclophilin A)